MAAFSTTITKLGVNGFYLDVTGSLLSGSTATSQVTLTCGALEDVFIFGYNPTGADDITLTLTASTAEGYASIGRGARTLTTAMASSDWFAVSQLESNWFQSTANSFVLTASTAIAIFAFERSSTRQL
jgi:hypothetical protein